MGESVFCVNFTGITHDHESSHSDRLSDSNQACSTIAILKRHTLYDSLVLVKKYRSCLEGYVLEFPSLSCEESGDSKENSSICNRRKLVSRYLDGDDPWLDSYQPQMKATDCSEAGLATPSDLPTNVIKSMELRQSAIGPVLNAYPQQIDDLNQLCDLVHVPINGLMDRLRDYTESGISVDSKVYAYAMGLKTAERFLTNGSMREINEAPAI